MNTVYLSTVSMEKNRWLPKVEDRVPSFRVSDYIEKIEEDGFSGIELWENHYLLSDEAEKQALVDSGAVKVFNSYLSFAQDDHTEIIDAICRFNPMGIKFNFGAIATVDTQIKNALAFADKLPKGCKMLCECHANTLMEVPETAKEVFAKLDDRFEAIVHLQTPMEQLKEIFDCYGDKVTHIHAAYSGQNGFAPYCEGEAKLKENWEFIKSCDFSGTISIEFVKDEKTAEETYQNACKELHWLKDTLMK